MRCGYICRIIIKLRGRKKFWRINEMFNSKVRQGWGVIGVVDMEGAGQDDEGKNIDMRGHEAAEGRRR